MCTSPLPSLLPSPKSLHILPACFATLSSLFYSCFSVFQFFFNWFLFQFQDFHFLCPNDTVFDQQHLVCTNWFEVDCHAQLAVSEKTTFFKMAASAPGLHQLVRGGLPCSAGGK
jgi:hypothetical protein